MNKTNFKIVLDKIKSDPDCWNQKKWHCGSQHCFFGWAQILSGKKENEETVRQDARMFLGLSSLEADYIAGQGRTIPDFEIALANGIYNREGYDRGGYDRGGYDRGGYNREGYNREGYDADGYDGDGLDRKNSPKGE